MDGEEDEWWFNVGFNLPIWTRRYEAVKREARAGVLESLAQLTDQQRQVFFEAQSALLALQSQQEQVRMLGERILPQARQALEADLAGYRAGSADFLDVLNDWQRLLALELIHQESVSGLGIALADLREAVGGQWPLPPEATPEPAATQESAASQPSAAQQPQVQP
jgi:outer membrane protein TolC